MTGSLKHETNEYPLRSPTPSSSESARNGCGSPRAAQRVRNVLPIAREFGLSAYDGAYLELAVRRGAPLATLDARLAKAALAAGVAVFPGR